jgi:hypothetical protein
VSELNWVQILGAARVRPDMYQGPPPTAHLRAGIQPMLQLLWEERAFEEPRGAAIAVSPHHFRCKCQSGPLLPELEQRVPWETEDHLFLAAFKTGASSPLLYLADRGALAIRTRAGLWCQSYEQGWPTTPPYLVTEAGHGVGLMMAVALNPQYCPGLPFTREAVEQIIPEAARPQVTLEWHEEDDLVPDCRVDPLCVLHPGNMGRWL